jgi:hypothetical protein
VTVSLRNRHRCAIAPAASPRLTPSPPLPPPPPKKPLQLEEADIIEKLERICSPTDDAGEWATRVDFVESSGGRVLKVVDTGSSSRCNAECSTAARACERAFGDSADLSDVSEQLYLQRRTASSIADEVCGEEGDGEGKACSAPAPALPKDRPAGPRHEPMSERDASVAKMMRQLKASGMGGQMFDREALMKNKKALKGLAGGGDDEDEEEEEEEEWETEGGGGAGAPGGGLGGSGSAVGAAAAQKVDEIASMAKETLGKGLGWIKGKVAGVAGGSAAGGSGGEL